jgi:nitroreductase
MELERAILERRSVRQFSDRPVERPVLEELLEAAVWAPSGGNCQPWAFVCVTDPAVVKKICTVTPGIFQVPKALICVCSDAIKGRSISGPMGEMIQCYNCGMAAQNIMLRAYDQGLGSCVIASFNGTALRVLLELPEHIVPRLLLVVGYPTRQPAPPPRNMDVIFWDKYGKEDGQ